MRQSGEKDLKNKKGEGRKKRGGTAEAIERKD